MPTASAVVADLVSLATGRAQAAFSIRLIDPLIPATRQIAGTPAQPFLSLTDTRGRT